MPLAQLIIFLSLFHRRCFHCVRSRPDYSDAPPKTTFNHLPISIQPLLLPLPLLPVSVLVLLQLPLLLFFFACPAKKPRIPNAAILDKHGFCPLCTNNPGGCGRLHRNYNNTCKPFRSCGTNKQSKANLRRDQSNKPNNPRTHEKPMNRGTKPFGSVLLLFCFSPIILYIQNMYRPAATNRLCPNMKYQSGGDNKSALPRNRKRCGWRLQTCYTARRI